MREVTEQDLLNISYEEYEGLSYFDTKLVYRVWNDAGRIKGLPYTLDADLYGDDILPYSDEGIALFKSWLKGQGASYYAAPREDFFEYKAVGKAIKEGNTFVYVEDLS